MNIPYLMAGLGLLVLGRRWAWFFTAGVFFFATLEIFYLFHATVSLVLITFVGVILGVCGAFLTGILPPVALAIGAALAGSFLFENLAVTLGWFPGQTWISYVVGGGLGLVLLAGEQDWARTVLSCLLGALMVVRQVTMLPANIPASYLGIALAGLLIQLVIMLVQKPKSTRVPEDSPEARGQLGPIRGGKR